MTHRIPIKLHLTGKSRLIFKFYCFVHLWFAGQEVAFFVMIITANGTTKTFERKICIHFRARGSEPKYAYTFWSYLFFVSRFLCEYFYLT